LIDSKFAGQPDKYEGKLAFAIINYAGKKEKGIQQL
jgi:hypothetical protein